MDKALTFSATISIIGVNPYVRPPDKVLDTLFKQANKTTSPLPIKGTINSVPFQQTLVRYDGDWRLYINIVMVKAANIQFTKSITEIVGKHVQLVVEYNSVPPTYEMNQYLKTALDTNVVAKKNWDQLTPSRQKEILRYFLGLKSDEAIQRNLQKVMAVLSGEEGRFMARSWKKGK